MNKTKIDSRGFTLVELLVVISIIGLLATTILISFNNTKNKAKDTIVFQSMLNISTIVQACVMDGGVLNVNSSSRLPVAGEAICNPAGDRMWPILPDPWYIDYIYLEQSTGYYMLAVTNGQSHTKLVVCDYSPPTWGGFGVRGNNTNKCTKIGFN